MQIALLSFFHNCRNANLYEYWLYRAIMENYFGFHHHMRFGYKKRACRTVPRAQKSSVVPEMHAWFSWALGGAYIHGMKQWMTHRIKSVWRCYGSEGKERATTRHRRITLLFKNRVQHVRPISHQLFWITCEYLWISTETLQHKKTFSKKHIFMKPVLRCKIPMSFFQPYVQHKKILNYIAHCFCDFRL